MVAVEVGLFDTYGCVVCGNGRLEVGEVCDGTDFGSTTCQDFGHPSGFLVCNPDCGSIDSSNCSNCGDGVATGAEECDDGAHATGDGCGADCRVEAGWTCDGTPSFCTTVCGDGILLGSEACDDGNLLSHDGCSSACTVERLTWVDRSNPVRPPERYGHDMAYDPVRDRVVVFGGYRPAFGYLSDTWEFDGVDWQEVFPTLSPCPRAWHGMVWNQVSERVFLFGGAGTGDPTDCDPYCAYSWEYDGTTWINVTPSQNPPRRSAHQLAFDVSRGVVVLFGGFNIDGTDCVNDTWEYDGIDWRSIATPFPPSARRGAG